MWEPVRTRQGRRLCRQAGRLSDRNDVRELLELAEREQTAKQRIRLMEQHRNRDERVFGVRPDIVLDATTWRRPP